MDTKSGGVARVYKGLEIVPGCRPFNKSVIGTSPGGEALCLRGHGRFPEDCPLGGTDIYDDIGKTAIGNLFYLLAYISLVIRKIGEIGSRVDPYIPRLSRRDFGTFRRHLRRVRSVRFAGLSLRST